MLNRSHRSWKEFADRSNDDADIKLLKLIVSSQEIQSDKNDRRFASPNKREIWRSQDMKTHSSTKHAREDNRDSNISTDSTNSQEAKDLLSEQQMRARRNRFIRHDTQSTAKSNSHEYETRKVRDNHYSRSHDRSIRQSDQESNLFT